jgi:Rod binding domain-containing protein
MIHTSKPHTHSPSIIDQAAMFGRGRMAARHGLGASQHDQLVKQAEKWVAQTFYGTLLKQMRDDPFHSDLFDGGKGGKAFEQVLDQRLADHMSRGAGGKLVRAIVHKIESAQAARKYAQASHKQAAVPRSRQHEGLSAEHSRLPKRIPAPIAGERF